MNELPSRGSPPPLYIFELFFNFSLSLPARLTAEGSFPIPGIYKIRTKPKIPPPGATNVL